MIIKPHRRTIYFLCDNPHRPADGGTGLKKYTLNMPEINFIVKETGNENYYFIQILDECGYPCYPPFTNVHHDGEVCMGEGWPEKSCYVWFYNQREFVDKFFNSVFTLSLPHEIKHYLGINLPFSNSNISDWYEAIDEFYTNWQETGKLNLIRK